MTARNPVWILVLPLLLTLASRAEPATAEQSLPEPAELFAAARDAMGAEDALGRIKSIIAVAACTSPRGPYGTRIDSADGGRVFFEQRRGGETSFSAHLNGDVGWYRDRDSGELRLTDAATNAFIRGHEFILMALEVDRRYRDPKTVGLGELGGRPCVEVRLVDELDQPATACFRRDNRLLAGMVIEPPTGGEPIRITFDEWTAIEGVRLPVHVTITQGEEVFTFTYTDVRLNAVDEAIFEIPEEIRALVHERAGHLD